MISVQTDAVKEEKSTFQDILMDTEWCVQIEPTQNPGYILLLTMKDNLDYGWL